MIEPAADPAVGLLGQQARYEAYAASYMGLSVAATYRLCNVAN